MTQALTLEVEAEELETHGHPLLQSKFKTSMEYMRLCLKVSWAVEHTSGPVSSLQAALGPTGAHAGGVQLTTLQF